ncbi:MAG: aminopeptidase P family protein [Candidatus Omnitrophica bacterium]|nr:aminopeptidase P family protein [Candidatus Omnitrophota bacterium]
MSMNYAQRTQAVLRQMEQENADWFFVTNPFNVRYLSGFTGSHGVLLIHPERRFILTDGRYSEQVQREVTEYEAVIQGNRQEIEAIRDTVGDLSSDRVWIESENCTVARLEELQTTVPARAYVGQKNVVEALRAVKEEAEIEAIRQALRVAEQAFEKALGFIREGITERELAHFLEDEMWKGGAAKESFDSLILFGPNSSLCHGKPSDRRLKRGEVVLMDFGCVIDGYCSDITRTVFLGDPGDSFKSLYQCVYQANARAAEAIRPGITGVQGDEFARDVIRQAGHADLFVHGLGHGVGLEIHEAPRLSPLYDKEIQAGNVVTIEPGVYIPGSGGIRIEDMAVVREDGCEVLNQTSKEMIVL